MMQGWEVKKLGDILKLEYGKPLPQINRKSDGLYPVYGANGVIDWSDEFYYEKETIIIGRKGSAGQLTLTASKFWPLDVTYFVTFDEKINDLLFLYHLLTFLDIPKFAKGVKPGINRNEVYDISVSIPSLPEQKSIVAILEEAFSIIDKAKENAQKNLQNAKELFESYLQSVFANHGGDWERKKLRDVSEFKSGTTIPVKYEKKEGDLLYVKVGDMNLLENQVEITSSSRFASSKEIAPNQLISSGSVIFPKRGGAIATNKKRRIVKPTIVDLNTMAITPSKVIDVDFFYWWFLTVDLIKISNGTTIPQINNYSFDNTYISYPKSIEKQEEIAKIFLNISVLSTDLQKLYKQKILALEELKKSMLQNAFNGKLKTTSEIET
jgi:type I restriction enzyme S subunit